MTRDAARAKQIVVVVAAPNETAKNLGPVPEAAI
jgi:hypothetical protein